MHRHTDTATRLLGGYIPPLLEQRSQVRRAELISRSSHLDRAPWLCVFLAGCSRLWTCWLCSWPASQVSTSGVEILSAYLGSLLKQLRGSPLWCSLSRAVPCVNGSKETTQQSVRRTGELSCCVGRDSRYADRSVTQEPCTIKACIKVGGWGYKDRSCSKLGITSNWRSPQIEDHLELGTTSNWGSPQHTLAGMPIAISGPHAGLLRSLKIVCIPLGDT